MEPRPHYASRLQQTTLPGVSSPKRVTCSTFSWGTQGGFLEVASPATTRKHGRRKNKQPWTKIYLLLEMVMFCCFFCEFSGLLGRKVEDLRHVVSYFLFFCSYTPRKLTAGIQKWRWMKDDLPIFLGVGLSHTIHGTGIWVPTFAIKIYINIPVPCKVGPYQI